MNNNVLPPDTPEGYKLNTNIIYGKRASHPGLFEIKLHSPKNRNAISYPMQLKLAALLKEAEADEDVKCILLHGGKYYSSGNDLSMFLKTKDLKKAIEMAKEAVTVGMVDTIMTMARISKPLIVLVRGGCYGIAYTLLGHATLVYCTPDAEFKTPFMESAQSPEGTSTLLFP